MCGIAGFYGNTKLISKEKIDKCFSLMGRRGPDGKGMYKDDTVLLLHTRLAIIDLSDKANQPFESNTGVFIGNGELYNYIELKREWKAINGTLDNFESENDMEVLFKLLEVDFDMLSHCEGMWAFAHYNKQTKLLTLCRDRFGEKPLFVYKDNDGFYFASEIKFIEALIDYSLEVNYNQIFRNVYCGYRSLFKNREETYFKGVEEVQPGTTCSYKDGMLLPISYWNPKESYLSDLHYDFNEVVEEVRELLISAIGLRLRSDVPLAFLISGGMDSNTVISIAKQWFNYDVHGFTIVNDDKRYSEEEMVKKSCKHLGINYTPIKLETDNFLENLKSVVSYHSAPVMAISEYLHWLLIKEIAKEDYKVVLSGIGGDELFSGYWDHHYYYLHEMKGKINYPERLASFLSEVLPQIRNPHLKEFGAFDVSNRNYLYGDGRFSKYILAGRKEEFCDKRFTDDKLKNRMANELLYETVPPILAESDLNSMYFSIENRSPFLDSKLFDFLAKTPTEYFIHKGFGKYIMRSAMKGIVAEPVLMSKTKIGFNAPIQKIFNIRNREVFDWASSGEDIWDMFDKNMMLALMMKREVHSNEESKFIFNFINVKMFLEERNNL